MKHNDYLGAPIVDEVHMTVEPNNDARIAKSDRLRVIEMEKAKLRLEAQKRKALAERQKEKARDVRSYKYAKMLDRSLNRKDDLLAAALMQKHTPFSKSAMINNPLAGFIPAQAMKQEGASAFDPDFNIYMAVPAQEFTNQIRQKDLHYKDFPLVDNVSTKGDFSGVLLSEKGSPDYSTMIVNDAKNDFGAWYDPRTWFDKSEEQKQKEALETQQQKAMTWAMYAGIGVSIAYAISLLRKK